MMVSTATADTPLRQAWPLVLRGQAGGLAVRLREMARLLVRRGWVGAIGDILFKDASLPRGSTRPSFDSAQDGEPVEPSRLASQQFRHEPS